MFNRNNDIRSLRIDRCQCIIIIIIIIRIIHEQIYESGKKMHTPEIQMFIIANSKFRILFLFPFFSTRDATTKTTQSGVFFPNYSKVLSIRLHTERLKIVFPTIITFKIFKTLRLIRRKKNESKRIIILSTLL